VNLSSAASSCCRQSAAAASSEGGRAVSLDVGDSAHCSAGQHSTVEHNAHTYAVCAHSLCARRSAAFAPGLGGLNSHLLKAARQRIIEDEGGIQEALRFAQPAVETVSRKINTGRACVVAPTPSPVRIVALGSVASACQHPAADEGGRSVAQAVAACRWRSALETLIGQVSNPASSSSAGLQGMQHHPAARQRQVGYPGASAPQPDKIDEHEI
jgi:hypothetical protein